MRRRYLIVILAAISAIGGWTRAAELTRVSVLTAKQVIQILDDTVDWYRTLGTQQENASEPSDLLILYANRQTADQVVGLAFEIARANAELLSSEANAGQSTADVSAPLALDQRQSQLDDKRKSIQKEMADDRRRSAEKLPLLRDELAMVNAHKNLLDMMAAFVNQSSPKGADANALKAHIDAIAATVPTAGTTPAAAGKPTASSAMNIEATAPERYGLWDLGSNAFKLRNKMKTIDAIDQRTTALAAMFKKISAPPLDQLHVYSARSDALAAQAQSTTGAELATLRGEFDTLAWLFKQTSDILLPLSKEQVLLQQYRHNLSNWRETTQREYHDALAALAVRLAVLAGILAAVFLLAEIWRRAVLRYSHDMRRRSQLLLIRKIITWVAVICIIGVSFATEISTFATFAGLLTAGVAVAMQSVLVSIVGYFFLIGKYGIRVGDRIQIGNVVGEVIDIGLVRLHLMELNSNGPLGPTGRVVAFANLVVFQASGGLFKQIPGVSISWHEMKINLPVVKDYAALKERLLAAVGEVAARYRDEIVRQSKEIQRSTASTSVNDTSPQVRMHLMEGRMEALIRYPVHIEHAAEIDEEVSEAVLRVIAENADMRSDG